MVRALDKADAKLTLSSAL